ncbi:hypothetical protein JHK85_011936 [Glycine max]|nr:hypothetical protein JHK85_011936 [Glycine max]
MLAGFAKAGELGLARRVFSEMPLRDEAGAFEFGKILHGFVEKAGFLYVGSVNNALIDTIDTYSKCGNVAMARLVFQNMPVARSIVSWTSIIAGLAMHGCGEEAIQLFHEMEESEVRPDGITFISLLYACSHSGLVEEGCVSPNAIIWKTLLGACSIHGNIEMAELVKARLAEMDPENSGDHVIYGFVAGEKPNEVTEEARDKQREIMLRLRTEAGYAPQLRSVLHDIEEEEKEDSVSKHSEKLAAAFGIAKLPKGRILRIVKNLRVCGDCHTVMKLIS